MHVSPLQFRVICYRRRLCQSNGHVKNAQF